MKSSNKFRLLAALLVSLIPLAFLRIFIFRRLFHLEIKNSQIGMCSILACEAAMIEDSIIGPFNVFVGPFRLEMTHATIGSFNCFECGSWVLGPQFPPERYKRTIRIRNGVLITRNHSFDVCGSITIGENTWIGGSHSQFWTHGAGVTGDILIGTDCYIGSAVRFSAPSEIGNGVLVSLGSVVTKTIAESNALVGGVPAKVIKQDYDWKKSGVQKDSP